MHTKYILAQPGCIHLSETTVITRLGCFYVTAILSWGWGWLEVYIEAEVDLKLRLKWSWVEVEVELKSSWSWVWVKVGLSWVTVIKVENGLS